MKRIFPLAASAAMLWLGGCNRANPVQTKAPDPTGPSLATAAVQEKGGFGQQDELYPLLKGGKYGFVNHEGRMVLEPKYMMAYRFSEGLAVVVNDKRKCGYIDRYGNTVIEHKFDGAAPFYEGYATVWIGNRAGVIDKSGNLKVDPQFVRVGRFSDGLAPAVIMRDIHGVKAVDGGYIDPTGKWVIPAQFDQALTPFGEGLAGVRRLGQMWSFIDRNEKTVIAPKLYQVGTFSEGLAGAMDAGSRWGFIDKTGKWAITPRFHRVRNFNEGLAGAESYDGRKWGYVDKKGDMVIKDQFDGVDQFLNGVAMVQVGTKIGYIDAKGAFVIPPSE